MRKLFLPVISFFISFTVQSQITYIFKGNGYWTTASNWNNNNIPPATLPAGSTINISPANGDSCVLNIFQTIATGAFLNISAGANFIISGNLANMGGSTFTDERDGQVYPYKHIGTQVWMTKNMNYVTANSWCYQNNSTNCEIYGRLYNWNAALEAAPPGWHIPSNDEWTTLTTFLGNNGGAMKSVTGWNAPNTGATNSSAFSGLPGGIWEAPGFFDFIGTNGYWWSSTESSADTIYAWRLALNYYFAAVYPGTNLKTNGYSVRCIRDN